MEQNSAPPSERRPIRRSERPLLRIPLHVEGTNADGNLFKERTFTVLISRNGARISLKNPVRVGDRITLTNLLTQQACPFRVVDPIATPMGEGPEWGVECLDPIETFWGVRFPEKREDLPQPEIIDALVECRECHSREMAQLVLEDYRELNNQGSLKRGCPSCGREREWVFGTVEVAIEEPGTHSLDPVYLPVAPPRTLERRAAKRYVVMLPLRTRHWDGEVEETRTENLSKVGICFMSDLVMQERDILFLTVGDRPKEQQVEVSARIAWRRPLEGNKSLYGVRLGDPKE